MIATIRNLLIKELRHLLERIENDEAADCSDEEAMRIISAISHEPMSKEQVIAHLGWSRAKFDDYCARGLMPKGRKRRGWKELCWFRDEINDCIMVLRQKYNYRK